MAMTGKINWRGHRGSSLVQPGIGKKLVSADGTKWAISRMQKRSLSDHRYDAVECWTLKQRINGKVVIVGIQRGEEDARKFVGLEAIPAESTGLDTRL